MDPGVPYGFRATLDLAHNKIPWDAWGLRVPMYLVGASSGHPRKPTQQPARRSTGDGLVSLAMLPLALTLTRVIIWNRWETLELPEICG